MKLVFIHGWGLDMGLWDGISALLPELSQSRIDLGFYGKPQSADGTDAILVGHSLGFVHGLQHYQNWRSWIAINSFPRFIKNSSLPGCVPPMVLRDICLRLGEDPQKTLHDFHAFIGAKPPQGTIDPERLREGLDELKTIDAAALAARLPGLVIASKNDPLVPLKVSEALVKDKKLALHESSDHMLPQSEPAFCAAAIRDFVKTL